MIQLTDTHCHLDFDVYDEDRELAVLRARDSGIDLIINPGIDIPSSRNAVDLSRQYPGLVFAAMGFHPNYANLWNEKSLEDLRTLAKDNKVKAIGEIGLDYYREHAAHETQKSVFLAQLDLARELELPLLIHNRDADEDLIPILSHWYHNLPANSRLLRNPGVLHSFSSDLEVAELFIKMNFFIGITGPVTFKNAAQRKDIVAKLPLESLLLETDSPYLTPQPYRGRRNEPANIIYIAREIANLHSCSVEHVARVTTANARELFAV